MSCVLLALLAASSTTASAVQVQGCALSIIDRAELVHAVELEAIDRQGSLHISSLDCADPSKIELVFTPLLGAGTLTATISLTDVPMAFRGRTIAFVTKELLAAQPMPALRTKVAPKPRPVLPRDEVPLASANLFVAPLTRQPLGWSISGAIGINFRPRGRGTQRDTLPQAQLAVDGELLDFLLIRTSLSLDRSTSILHTQYSARLGLRPSLRLRLGPFALGGGAEYRAGAVWVSGTGSGAVATTSFAHALAGALFVRWFISPAVGLSADLVVGHEWGVEAFDDDELVFSSQGLFVNPTLGLTVTF